MFQLAPLIQLFSFLRRHKLVFRATCPPARLQKGVVVLASGVAVACARDPKLGRFFQRPRTRRRRRRNCSCRVPSACVWTRSRSARKKSIGGNALRFTKASMRTGDHCTRLNIAQTVSACTLAEGSAPEKGLHGINMQTSFFRGTRRAGRKLWRASLSLPP